MVLVMDNGLAAEWGRPATLLDNPNGTFTSTPSPLAPLPTCHPCCHGRLLKYYLMQIQYWLLPRACDLVRIMTKPRVCLHAHRDARGKHKSIIAMSAPR